MSLVSLVEWNVSLGSADVSWGGVRAIKTAAKETNGKPAQSLFSSHHKNWFAARREYLHLMKKNSQRANKYCEFFLIRCNYSQPAANQFLR